MRAFLKNNRQAPRKVRLIARVVIGKNAETAISELAFVPNKAAKTLQKLIESAVANASQKDTNIKANDLKVKNITVDKGITYVRYMPRAFGRAAPVRRECSHIHVTLDTVDVVAPNKKSVKEETDKTKKKTNKTTDAKKKKITSATAGAKAKVDKEEVSNKK